MKTLYIKEKYTEGELECILDNLVNSQKEDPKSDYDKGFNKGLEVLFKAILEDDSYSFAILGVCYSEFEKGYNTCLDNAKDMINDQIECDHDWEMFSTYKQCTYPECQLKEDKE